MVAFVDELEKLSYYVSGYFRNGKFVWMPTLDTYHHVETTGGATTGYLQGEEESGIRLLDKDGKVVSELKQILEIIAENDMILAIGHYPAAERTSVIDEALKIGVKRILADHPIEYHSKGTIDDLKVLAAKGVYIGMFALTCLIIPPVEGDDYPAKMFHGLPADNIVIGSDCGMTMALPHIDGIRWMIRYMLYHDISIKDIEKMLKKNPARLLGISE